MTARFLENKVKRNIDTNGVEYHFVRYKVDKYSTKTNEIENHTIVKGIMHIQTSYAKRRSQESSVTTKKNSPMILCLFKDAMCVQAGDEVMISRKKYFVTHKENINNFNVAVDISLEECRNE